MSSQKKITQGPQTDFQLQPARIRRGKTKPVVPPGKIEPKRIDWKFSFKAASKQEGGLAGALRGVRKEGDSWGDPQDLPKTVQDAAKVPRGWGTPNSLWVQQSRAWAVTHRAAFRWILPNQTILSLSLSLPESLFTVDCSLFSLRLCPILFTVLLKCLALRKSCRGESKAKRTHPRTKREGNGFSPCIHAKKKGRKWFSFTPGAGNSTWRELGLGTSCPAAAQLWWQQDGHHHAAQGPGLVGLCFPSFQGGFGWDKAGKTMERPNGEHKCHISTCWLHLAACA